MCSVLFFFKKGSYSGSNLRLDPSLSIYRKCFFYPSTGPFFIIQHITSLWTYDMHSNVHGFNCTLRSQEVLRLSAESTSTYINSCNPPSFDCLECNQLFFICLNSTNRAPPQQFCRPVQQIVFK